MNLDPCQMTVEDLLRLRLREVQRGLTSERPAQVVQAVRFKTLEDAVDHVLDAVGRCLRAQDARDVLGGPVEGD